MTLKPSHQETPHIPRYQWLVFFRNAQFDLAVSDQWMCWPFSRTYQSDKKKYGLSFKINNSVFQDHHPFIQICLNLLHHCTRNEISKKGLQEMYFTWCAEIPKWWASRVHMGKRSLCKPPGRWPCNWVTPALASNPRVSACSPVRIRY